MRRGQDEAASLVQVDAGQDRAVVTLNDRALTRRLGYQGAFAYYAAGEQLDAHRAQRLGLVREVVPEGELMAAADAWCDRIAALPSHAMAMTKPLLRAAADASWDQALTMEEFAEPQCFTTAAFQDSVQALLRSR